MSDRTDPITLVLSRVKDAKKTPNGWQGKCPAHDDNHASLTISKGNDGKALTKCQAGCTFADIAAALNLKQQDFFVKSDTAPAARKRIVATYPYVDEDGTLLYEKIRYEGKKFSQRRPDGNGGWIWNLEGIRRVPYRLPDLQNARDNDPDAWIALVEGVFLMNLNRAGV
jgi:putative DNA primase/helicase